MSSAIRNDQSGIASLRLPGVTCWRLPRFQDLQRRIGLRHKQTRLGQNMSAINFAVCATIPGVICNDHQDQEISGKFRRAWFAVPAERQQRTLTIARCLSE
jgi:hypothetical protein